MAAKSSSAKKSISDINVTPLVDIMLVLVIILMVTAEFTRYNSIPVALPKVNAAAMKKEPQRIVLTIKKDQSIWINDKALEAGQDLQSALESAKAGKTDLALILQAEEKTDYSFVVSVLEKVKTAGISKIGLAVEPLGGKKLKPGAY